MAEERLDMAPPEGGPVPAAPARRIALDVPSWLPSEKLPRGLLVAMAAVAVIVLIVGTTLPFAVGWLDQGDLQAFGYPGIFLANFLGTATVFVPVPGLAAAGRIDWLMQRYGFVTLLVLAGVPNPLFEFAGITAGAVRMSFWRFLLAVAIGKTVRVILLVIIGQALLDAFEP